MKKSIIAGMIAFIIGLVIDILICKHVYNLLEGNILFIYIIAMSLMLVVCLPFFIMSIYVYDDDDEYTFIIAFFRDIFYKK